jgi:type IV pilus assembly protein PilB
MSERLGELLVKESAITPEQLEQAQKLQREKGGRLGSALIKLGFLNETEVTTFVSRQYGIPAVNLA